ncbi:MULTISPECIES: energy-coupling factor transporter transmembrane protein EcfT [unclassified Adlercreutzia]|uniref:energy-coupling factor transporter transmembrane component T family protein n=1 Tax=unclassified Adlercreutzia TaxID=2636013 RepID=UPI0019825121|nr:MULTISPECIES: energy-coupling factor transporter transmembrane component T [unclassified Adlercreutzia]
MAHGETHSRAGAGDPGGARDAQGACREGQKGLPGEGPRSFAAGAFDALHPAVAVAYAAIALVLTMAAFQPVLVALALAAAICLGVCLRGGRQVACAALWQVPMLVLVALANPLFAPMGSTELFRIGVRAVYLESFAYGLCMGALLVAVMVEFANAACVLTSDKVTGVLGNRLPTVALMTSMCMRLIPRFVRQGREISAVQKACTAARRNVARTSANGLAHAEASESAAACASQRASEAAGARALRASRPPIAPSGAGRLREGVRVASALVGWGMEDSLETADAMRSRGWASGRARTTYRRQRFSRADALALAVVLGLGAVCAACAWTAASQYRFYPSLSTLTLWWGYVPYALYFFLPCLVILGDRLRWMR